MYRYTGSIFKQQCSIIQNGPGMRTMCVSSKHVAKHKQTYVKLISSVHKQTYSCLI
jgi:hypothetical protein